MRRPLLSVSILFFTFALGVSTASQVERLREFVFDVETLPPATGFEELLVAETECRTLVVSVDGRRQLWLNSFHVGTLDHTDKLTSWLDTIARHRQQAGLAEKGIGHCAGLPPDVPVERAVYVKAPRTLAYGDLALVLGAVEASGAGPIKLLFQDEARDF